MEYNGEELTIISDERAVFSASLPTMKKIAEELLYTCSVITDKDLKLRDKKALLKDTPSMYPQIFGEHDPLWIEYEAQYTPTEYLPTNKKKSSGYIYVIKAVGHNYYKIGFSKDVAQRIKNLDRQYPFEIELYTQFKSNDVLGDEKKLHNEFKGKNYRGEWFNLDKHDLEKIEKYKG
jgi:hypothetical protein